MPAVTRVGDVNTGHDACPPTALASGSSNVFVNGISVGRVGDPYNPHGCIAHIPHVGNIASGAPHVFVNGKAVGRVGDPVTCGGSVATGSSNVFVGNG
ncbi:MAG: PAAR domain-containing protein [Succinivibrio sp.]